ncbi:zinc-dependent alcohol dehydrogenase family protein [Pseudarthrobacter sp. NPDC057230]|uniref:zinc-dependent alcohol dehydrogenase family protein n=1 Tax=Pseudarthrobacter sp. NPDC057230 TaxID=3346057 RepID=UPI0036367E6A
MQTHHRAVVAERFGDPAGALSVEVVPTPKHEEQDVLVRMRWAAVNPSDVLPIRGAYRSRTGLPFIPGFEGMGVIAEGQPGEGSRVIPIGLPGAWQEIRSVPRRWCIPVPGDVPDHAAATAFINPLSALLMTDSYALPGGTALINAGSSALSRLLAYLLRRKGMYVIGVGSSGNPHKTVWDDYKDPGLMSSGKARHSVDILFDCVGGIEGLELASAVRKGGAYVHYGLLSGMPSIRQLTDKRADVGVHLFKLRDVVHTASDHRIHELFDRSFDLIRQGMATRIAATRPLEDVVAAIILSVQRPTRGKVLLRV